MLWLSHYDDYHSGVHSLMVLVVAAADGFDFDDDDVVKVVVVDDVSLMNGLIDLNLQRN